MLINGAPGSGKSTLARRWVDDVPLSLALDIDAVRSMIGRWLDSPTHAGELARAMALEMGRTHLGAGHDVVVPQFLGRVDYVLALERLSAECDADFVEVALVSDAVDIQRRFARRSVDPQNDRHVEAAALLELSGGLDALPEMYDQLLAVIAQRPRTRTIVVVDGDRDATYAALLEQLAG